MTSYKDAVSPSTPAEHLTGRVKWFNNKAGYGFITVTDGSRSGTDVFVHHSAINVENQQYKYLIQGEYVDFDLIKTESEKHEWQASKVAGIKGGKLMCETRRELKQARTEYKSTKESVAEPKQKAVPSEATVKSEATVRSEKSAPKQKTTTARARGEGPRETAVKKGPITKVDSEGNEWTLVAKRESAPAQKPRGRPPRKAVAESK